MRVIHVLRKPLSEGTVASNVVKHGCGGLNIDGSRVSGVKEVPGGKARTAEQGAAYGDLGAQATGPDGRGVTSGWDPNTGRFPANVILQHLDGCRCDGIKKVKGSAQASAPSLWGKSSSYTLADGMQGVATSACHTDENGMETVAAWACESGCPVAELDRQSGVLTSHGGGTSKGLGYGSTAKAVRVRVQGDKGGASRFFKQVGGQKDG